MEQILTKMEKALKKTDDQRQICESLREIQQLVKTICELRPDKSGNLWMHAQSLADEAKFL